MCRHRADGHCQDRAAGRRARTLAGLVDMQGAALKPEATAHSVVPQTRFGEPVFDRPLADLAAGDRFLAFGDPGLRVDPYAFWGKRTAAGAVLPGDADHVQTCALCEGGERAIPPIPQRLPRLRTIRAGKVRERDNAAGPALVCQPAPAGFACRHPDVEAVLVAASAAWVVAVARRPRQRLRAAQRLAAKAWSDWRERCFGAAAPLVVPAPRADAQGSGPKLSSPSRGLFPATAGFRLGAVPDGPVRVLAPREALQRSEGALRVFRTTSRRPIRTQPTGRRGGPAVSARDRARDDRASPRPVSSPAALRPLRASPPARAWPRTRALWRHCAGPISKCTRGCGAGCDQVPEAED